MNDTGDYRYLDMITSPVFVLEAGNDGCPTYVAVNKAAADLLYLSPDDLPGRAAEDIFPSPAGSIIAHHHAGCFRHGAETTYEVTVPIAGRAVTLRTTLRPEKDAEGRVLRVFGNPVDTADERRAVEARIEYDTLSSEMEQFVAFAAHDLRAPMRNISELATVLREDFGELGEGQLKIISLIEDITVQSMDLITDVLSHAETVSTNTHETVFSFPVLCHAICQSVDATGAHGFSTSISNLKADRAAIQIVLRNLIENAIRHGERDRLEIDISVQQGMPGMIEITVTDDGAGFSDAALKIMNGGRFRSDSSYGLFGVKRLVSGRGGTLVARNLPSGAGAVVRFSIPGQMLGVDARRDAPSADLRLLSEAPALATKNIA